MTRSLAKPRALFVPVILILLACTGDAFRSCTSLVVGKTVETTKEVTTGVAEGIQEGRKAGESVDGAALVSGYGDLEGKGAVSVYALEGEGSPVSVVLAIENTGDVPLRVSGLEVAVLDKEGFVKHPMSSSKISVTVPPKAKERVSVNFDLEPDLVGTVRVWGEDVELPAGR